MPKGCGTIRALAFWRGCTEEAMAVAKCFYDVIFEHFKREWNQPMLISTDRKPIFGNHYQSVPAAWHLLLGLEGLRWDVPGKKLWIRPNLPESFQGKLRAFLPGAVTWGGLDYSCVEPDCDQKFVLTFERPFELEFLGVRNSGKPTVSAARAGAALPCCAAGSGCRRIRGAVHAAAATGRQTPGDSHREQLVTLAAPSLPRERGELPCLFGGDGRGAQPDRRGTEGLQGNRVVGAGHEQASLEQSRNTVPIVGMIGDLVQGDNPFQMVPVVAARPLGQFQSPLPLAAEQQAVDMDFDARLAVSLARVFRDVSKVALLGTPLVQLACGGHPNRRVEAARPTPKSQETAGFS